MAIIRCPECGKEISDKAKTCIFCGCPIQEAATTGKVRIKMPNNIVNGWVGLFSSRRAVVRDSKGTILWTGNHGENACFEVNNQLGSYAKVAKKLHRSSDTVSRYIHEHEAAVNAVRVVIDAQNT